MKKIYIYIYMYYIKMYVKILKILRGRILLSFSEKEKIAYVPRSFAAANPAFRARLGKETHRKQMELHTWREQRLIA